MKIHVHSRNDTEIVQRTHIYISILPTQSQFVSNEMQKKAEVINGRMERDGKGVQIYSLEVLGYTLKEVYNTGTERQETERMKI